MKRQKYSAMDQVKLKTNSVVTNDVLESEPRGKIAHEKIMVILKDYNCQLICVPRVVYGQTVYVPVVDELPEQTSKK